MCSVAKICVVLLVIVAVLAAVVGGVLWRLRPGTISTYALPSVRNCDGNESMCTETHSARNALTGAVEIGPLRMAVLDNALKVLCFPLGWRTRLAFSFNCCVFVDHSGI